MSTAQREIGMPAPAAVREVLPLLATILAGAIVLSGCIPRPPLSVAPSFTRYLADSGTTFTQAIAPADLADWHKTFEGQVGGFVRRHGSPNAERGLRPIYGVIHCVDPARGCDVFVAEVGQERAIWYVDFDDRSGCREWMSVDAQSGDIGVGGGGRRAGACSP